MQIFFLIYNAISNIFLQGAGDEDEDDDDEDDGDLSKYDIWNDDEDDDRNDKKDDRVRI